MCYKSCKEEDVGIFFPHWAKTCGDLRLKLLDIKTRKLGHLCKTHKEYDQA